MGAAAEQYADLTVLTSDNPAPRTPWPSSGTFSRGSAAPIW
ncbi:MAG: hypothetical protein ACLR5H_09780 [Oscillospiraceae bacterium]